MRMPLTLSFYIGRQFLLSILYALLVITAITLLVDIIELLRRASGRDAIPLGIVLQMALLKSPNMANKLLPFAVLIGSLIALMRLTRTQELVVARSAGVSVWQFLAPALTLVAAMALFTAAVFSPIASAMLLKFEHYENRYYRGRPSMLAVSPSGLWLRQMEEGNSEVSEHIIYALRISQTDMTFSSVIVFSFNQQGKFTERLDASSANLEQGTLVLKGVTRSLPGKPPEGVAEYRLPTNLQMAQLQNSFASPETISFWRLPTFISVLENAGFSALRHRIYWQSMLSSPILFAGMVLIAALFSLRLPRFGKIGPLIGAGGLIGFVLYFLTDILHALGMAGTLPVWIAAWAPAAIILMLGAGTLLHLEDG